MFGMSAVLSEMLALMDEFGELPIIEGVDDMFVGPEPILSDELWSKFQEDFPEFDDFDDIMSDLTDRAVSPFGTLECYDIIRNHDCMWAGHCLDKDHPVENSKNAINLATCLTPAPEKAPVFQHPITPGRSLLLKPAVKAAPVTISPDSPPMSDDEENKSKTATATMHFLTDTPSECDGDEDSDLCEYLEEEEEEGENAAEADAEPAEEPRSRFAGENDHCYFMDKNTFTRVTNLGIDTPSDSEEEIDVVSVGDKTTNRLVYTLPTNPSTRDRRHLQRRIGTAISNQSMPDTQIKPVMIRKTSVEVSTAKQRQESRGVKRSRQSRTNPPYKRRAYSTHNSDSEPEPSEKRSLHNNMERQRRIDLRNAFEDLRVLVPEVSSKEKAAKVVILREAAQYCYQLTTASSNMMRHKMELKRQQEQLRARVSYLRRTLAAKR